MTAAGPAGQHDGPWEHAVSPASNRRAEAATVRTWPTDPIGPASTPPSPASAWPSSSSRATRSWPIRPSSARRTGSPSEDSANTIVVVGKADPRVYAACIVLAPHRLDVNHAVKARLGTRKASFASADETRELTGMAIGGVTPFGLPAELPVFVDAAVMARPRIVLGGGSRSWKVIAAPSILLALPNVTVVEGLAG